MFRTKAQIIGTDDLWGNLFHKSATESEKMQLSGVLNGRKVSVLCWEATQNSASLQHLSSGRAAEASLLFRQDTTLDYEICCDDAEMTGIYSAASGEILNSFISGSPSEIEWPWTRIHYVPPLRGGNQDLSELLGEIELRSKKQELLSVLRLLDPSIQDIVSVNRQGSGEIFVRTEDSVLLPLALAGDGLRNLLMIALYSMVGAPGIILIDEIENGFHHSLYEPVWRVLCTLVHGVPGTQILATTHSYEFVTDAALAAISAEMQDSFCMFRIDREHGRTLSTRYTAEDLEAAEELRMEVR